MGAIAHAVRSTGVRGVRRAGSTRWGWLVCFCLLTLLPASLAGQVPDTVPADTVGGDTLQLPIPPETMVPDTLPTDSVGQDSAVPVPPFPHFPAPPGGGWATARWQWDRDELLRFHSLSLLDLIERLPGMTAFRAGDFGQPAGLSALGYAGSRLRVFLDGFELDPLGFTTPDLQQISLADLAEVRVERGLGGIRVDLVPLRLPDARPISMVEAATGLYDTKLLRSMLMRGIGRRATVLAGFDQATSRGFGFREAFTYRTARAALSYALAERTSLQVEYRAEASESGAEAIPVDASRRTLLLRARSEPIPGVHVDGMVGRMLRRPEEADPLDVELGGYQGALRTALDLGRVWLEGSARLRTDTDERAEPGMELEARGIALPLPWLLAEGRIRAASVHDVSGTEGVGTVRVGPVAGLSAFGSLGFGSRPLALVRNTTLPAEATFPFLPVTDERVEPRFSAVSASSAGARVGAEWTLGSGIAGVAGIAVPEGRVAPFGFTSVDRGFAAVDVGAARAVEAFASVPVPFTREYLRVEGWFTRWEETGGRPYLPLQSGRLALRANGLFFGGELEPTLRIEAVHHGRALVPDAEGTGFAAESLPYTLANLQLQIRILDVRAFFIFDNLTDQRGLTDLPERILPGGRFYYGLRWTFRN
jgi:TonB-dependent Receptor Plug Domain